MSLQGRTPGFWSTPKSPSPKPPPWRSPLSKAPQAPPPSPPNPHAPAETCWLCLISSIDFDHHALLSNCSLGRVLSEEFYMLRAAPGLGSYFKAMSAEVRQTQHKNKLCTTCWLLVLESGLIDTGQIWEQNVEQANNGIDCDALQKWIKPKQTHLCVVAVRGFGKLFVQFRFCEKRVRAQSPSFKRLNRRRHSLNR